MIKKETEKILKYQDFIIEIQRMRNVKAKLIPVTREATGTISKSLRQYLRNIEEKHEIQELQKTALYTHTHTHTHTHTLRGSADVKAQNTFHGRNNITCNINGEYRTAATLYAAEKWFVLGIYIYVNTLHKGDDNNNNNSKFIFHLWKC